MKQLRHTDNPRTGTCFNSLVVQSTVLNVYFVFPIIFYFLVFFKALKKVLYIQRAPKTYFLNKARKEGKSDESRKSLIDPKAASGLHLEGSVGYTVS